MKTVVLFLSLTLAGCASDIARPIREAPAVDISFAQALQNPEQHRTAAVRWGGAIVSVENQRDSSLIEIVERPHGVKGFQLLPRRWVVERTFAWFGRCRRLSKDFEGSPETELAWLLVAHLRLLTRRLAASNVAF